MCGVCDSTDRSAIQLRRRSVYTIHNAPWQPSVLGSNCFEESNTASDVHRSGNIERATYVSTLSCSNARVLHLHEFSIQFDVEASHTKRVCGTHLLPTIAINTRLRSNVEPVADTCEGCPVPISNYLCVLIDDSQHDPMTQTVYTHYQKSCLAATRAGERQFRIMGCGLRCAIQCLIVRATQVFTVYLITLYC